MGNLWNPKSCRCKICGKTFPQINKGCAHLLVRHGKTWNMARKLLEVEKGAI